MTTGRLLLTFLAAFVFAFGSDFLVHSVWMAPDYKSTASLWRPESEMMARFPAMLGAHVLIAAIAVLLWARGFVNRGSLANGLVFGLLLGLFSQANTLITWVVTPLPGPMAVKWFTAGTLQGVGLGLVIALVARPRPAA